MSFSEKLSNFLIATLTFVFWLLIPSVALAAFDASMCNVMNIVTGTAGRTFAVFAVASVGVGFYTGKVSWGVLIGVAAGIGVIFGAPSIVAAVSGSDVFECRKGVQVVTCNDDGCFACPVGFTGENCDECSVGFSGENCNQCQNGYVGERCSECSDGFSKVDGMCQAGCKITEEKGLTLSSLYPGSRTIKCDKLNFTGTYKYSCTNGALQVLSNSCICQRNFTGENCDQCNPGYKGTNCEECDAGYTMINKVCHKDCQVEDSTIFGVVGKAALPLAGRLTCDKDVKKFAGSVNYSCIGGVFKIESGSCVCATGYQGSDCLACSSGYIPDAEGNCVGALSCAVSIVGSSVKKTIAHAAEDTANCDAVGYSGIATYSCNNGDLSINIPCYKNCTFSIAGVTAPITVNHGGSGSAQCNASGYKSETVNFSCNNGVPTSGSCSCADGYGGTNCSGCVGDFVKVGTSCLAKCSVNVTGSSSTSVNPGDGTVTCDKTGYSGAISYSCENGVAITGTCSCAVGYSGSNCSSCDTASGYVLSGGVCAKVCSVSLAGTNTTQVNPGSFTFSCDKTGYSGASISGNCASGSLSITSATTTCACATNYTGTNCSSCVAGHDIATGCSSCLSGYSLISGQCRQKCLLSATGIASGTYVDHGTTSKACDAGYSGTITYNCSDGTISNVSGICQASDCTGGTKTILSSGLRVHKFTSQDTFSCPVTKTIRYLVVAGGGGGGRKHAGGGGAGGYLEGSISVSSGTSYGITIGSGGSGSTSENSSGSRGSDSAIGNIVVARGGGGGGSNNAGATSGGSGGGGSNYLAGAISSDSSQGNNGGNPGGCCTGAGAGGGGAGKAADSFAVGGKPTNGGDGKSSSISGFVVYYSGGGGGGNGKAGTTVGGSGGGGNGGDINSACTNGENGYGGGGGGGGYGNGGVYDVGCAGGSGVVIISY